MNSYSIYKIDNHKRRKVKGFIIRMGHDDLVGPSDEGKNQELMGIKLIFLN
jgi:hypothetical protein